VGGKEGKQPVAKRIHLIFKTHLDIGFTDLAANVLRKYFDRFIPMALDLARTTREGGGKERFIWTTGSFLVYQYLEQASPEARRLMEQAIEAGDIAWHGLPFTTHTELLDESMFRFGLSLSRKLDKRFGKKTIAAKMTDVPGHTRSMVPLLAEAGIKFLHIGVNSASTPPDVPPLFVWREPGGAEVVVMYQKSYGDVMVLPGTDEAVAFSFTGDNHGPHSPEAIAKIYEGIRDQFPGAEVTASTLNECARSVESIRAALPVVTQELGDTWIHGTGTDPLKVARYRELCRARRSWIASGALEAGSPTDMRFSLPLLMIAEHTWGMDEKSHLNDYEHYKTADLLSVRDQPNFRLIESSWAEKRAYIDQAVSALGDTPLCAKARQLVKEPVPEKPDLSGFWEVPDTAALFHCGRFDIGFDPKTGAIRHLLDGRSGRNWASEGNPLARLGYQTFAQADYDRFLGQYLTKQVDWALKDFGKPGIEKAGAVHRWLDSEMTALHNREDEHGSCFVVELHVPGAGGGDIGCPEKLTLMVDLPSASDAPIALDLRWFKKPAFRLPEAIWFSFSPRISRADGWVMQKMGRKVSPLDVIPGGNRHLHAIDQYVAYRDDHGRMEIRSLDAQLVAPGGPSLLDFNNRRPPMLRGMHFSLYNNVWGTNFPMWYDDDARFRFALVCE
jgi:hypothetical protein